MCLSWGTQHLPEGCSIYKNKGELLAFTLLSDNNRSRLIDLKVDGLIKKEREYLKPEVTSLSFKSALTFTFAYQYHSYDLSS